MSDTPAASVTSTIEHGVGVIMVDYPPVNALSAGVRAGLDSALRDLTADPEVAAIVLVCAGRTFFAGADIAEFGKPVASPTLLDIIERFNRSEKPVVAAIHGTALGGGFELALACHFRVAANSARVGFPEVKLGFPPGAGGTQIVPRLAGAEVALDILVSGRQVGAEEALAAGLVDRVVPDDQLRGMAIDFAREAAEAHTPLTHARDRSEWTTADRQNPDLFATFRTANGHRFRGQPAPIAVVDLIEAAVFRPYGEGIALEQQLFAELADSDQAAALRHLFFAEREARRAPGLKPNTPSLEIKSVAVIGAGTMGSGIALAMLGGGFSVVLIDSNGDALARAKAHIERHYASQVAKGRLDPAKAERFLASLVTASDVAAAGAADLIIEAVFEDLKLKRELFATLDAVAQPHALLASNTSFLDVDAIAAATNRPESVLGLHFFSPANVMRLLEVVRAARTSDMAIATAFKLASTIGKVAVQSLVCDGFIANRIMRHRALQADRMALEGTPIAAIDQALVEYGFSVGHFRMMDMVGLDVIGRGSTERSVIGDLVAAGRLGQKSGAGYYDYDATGRPTLPTLVAEVIRDVAAASTIREDVTNELDRIIDRLLLPVVNEGARLLEEGVAARASDIDVAAILGYNWPAQTGGPMFWAETIGLDVVVQRLRQFEALHGPAFAPCDLLLRKAASGERF